MISQRVVVGELWLFCHPSVSFVTAFTLQVSGSCCRPLLQLFLCCQSSCHEIRRAGGFFSSRETLDHHSDGVEVLMLGLCCYPLVVSLVETASSWMI